MDAHTQPGQTLIYKVDKKKKQQILFAWELIQTYFGVFLATKDCDNLFIVSCYNVFLKACTISEAMKLIRGFTLEKKRIGLQNQSE